MMINQVKAYKVDAFVKNNSGGSPTGVVLNATGLTDGQMQFITDQLGVSHTAFVFEPATPGENVAVRFFTAGGEIVNCGHGTIAAHYTRAKHFNFSGHHVFYQQAKEGIQQIEVICEDQQVNIFVKQNKIHFLSPGIEEEKHLLEALNINATDLDSNYPIILASPGSKRFLLCVKSLELLNGIIPDFDRLKLVCDNVKSIGCFIYCIRSVQSKPEATARMFAPNIGVDEDIINGNSSGCLGAYLLNLKEEDNMELLVNQGHTLKCEGVVKVKVNKMDDHFETEIGGSAKIKTEILLTLP